MVRKIIRINVRETYSANKCSNTTSYTQCNARRAVRGAINERRALEYCFFAIVLKNELKIIYIIYFAFKCT